MLQVFNPCSSKLYRKFFSLWSTDLSCCVRTLCTDGDAVPQRVTSLRRRRSLRRGTAVSASAEHQDTVTSDSASIDHTETVPLSRKQKMKQREIVSADISVDSLRHQLNDAISVPQLDTELEFPSDILDKEKSEAFSRRDQARDAFRPRINPMDTSIVLFPGQGSQFVGMGAKLVAYPTAEKMYRVASNILGYNLLDMCLHGPKDVLSRTVHSQPAVLVTSLAAVEKLKETCPKVHSARLNIEWNVL